MTIGLRSVCGCLTYMVGEEWYPFLHKIKDIGVFLLIKRKKGKKDGEVLGVCGINLLFTLILSFGVPHF